MRTRTSSSHVAFRDARVTPMASTHFTRRLFRPVVVGEKFRHVDDTILRINTVTQHDAGTCFVTTDMKHTALFLRIRLTKGRWSHATR